LPLDRQRTPWLLPGHEWAALADDTAQQVTSTAPCCERCWPVADRLCPYLRAAPNWRGFLHRPRRWGVVGDIYLPGVTLRHRTMRDGSANTRVTLAKQLVVTWDHAEGR
jgi:hypothetical protein